MANQDQLAFNAAYWASKPPEVRALATIYDQDVRTSQASTLAMQGFVIDVPIMVWGWDPYLCMGLRQNFGYTWVPSALQPNVSIAPGLSAPGTVAYDPKNPPGGSIKVSTNLADYPAFDPAPAEPPVVTDYVGVQTMGNMYLVVPGDHTPNGVEVTNDRGTFVKRLVQTPFGFNAYYEKKAA